MHGRRPVAALIMAGGSGSRFGAGVPKQFVGMGGVPMIWRAAAPFASHSAVDEIVFVLPAGEEARFRQSAKETGMCEAGGVIVRTAVGGPDRAASVRNGLDAVSFADGLVLVHDAARPFVKAQTIDAVLEAAARRGAAVPCLPVTDTVYGIKDGGEARALDRGTLAAVQTPQGFDIALLREAHRYAFTHEIALTDDGGAALAYGRSVEFVEGDPGNRKVTRPGDLEEFSARPAEEGAASAGGSAGKCAAQHGLSAPSPFLVGIGFDAHRFCEGRPLVLGGVEIPFGRGLLGHSDADALTHALMDAILGALGEGDIGKLFPDTDPAYAGASSIALLGQVMAIARKNDCAVENADMTIVAQRPRIAPWREEIERSLAEALGVDPGRVSVKATTTELLGFTGREEGIAAQAAVLLRRA